VAPASSADLYSFWHGWGEKDWGRRKERKRGEGEDQGESARSLNDVSHKLSSHFLCLVGKGEIERKGRKGGKEGEEIVGRPMSAPLVCFIIASIPFQGGQE